MNKGHKGQEDQIIVFRTSKYISLIDINIMKSIAMLDLTFGKFMKS